MLKATMLPRFGVMLAVGTFVLAGCGESSAEKAKAEVCKARSAINTQVETLKGLSLSPTAIPAAEASFQTILKELEKIQKEAPKLQGQAKQSAEAATTSFKTEISAIASSLTKTFNPAEASTQFKAAVEKLAASYKQSLQTISC